MEYYTGQQLYNADILAREFLGDPVGLRPSWENASWQEKDYFEAQADELNEARREPV